jgi:hypothetical protein
VKGTLAALAVALATPLFVAPAVGDIYIQQQPDRAFALVMSGTSFNGLTYPDTPLLEASVGEVVQMTIVVPPTAEAHTFHLHGHPWFVPSNAPLSTFVNAPPSSGAVVDTSLLYPGDSHSFTVIAGGLGREAGDWMYHCHFDDHMAAGMWGVFRVYPYHIIVTGRAPGLDIKLDRLGEPVKDATFTATIDGSPIHVHALDLGDGRWTLHVPATRGALAITTHSATWGESVARVGLGGATVPQPTIRSAAPPGTLLEGHTHAG